MRLDIVPGAVFPDYELSDHRGMPSGQQLIISKDFFPLTLSLSKGALAFIDNLTRGKYRLGLR